MSDILALLRVVYILMPWFKRDWLRRGYLVASFVTVRRYFLEHAVVTEIRAETEIPLVLNNGYPLRREADLMLRKAIAA